MVESRRSLVALLNQSKGSVVTTPGAKEEES